MASEHKRRFRNYFLNKGLQLRYIVIVIAIATATSGVLGYLIYQQEAEASSLVKKLAADADLGLDAEQEINPEVSDRDNALVLIMLGAGLGMMFVLFLYLVVMTHRVAGPIYKVTLYFDKMRDGYLGSVWPLRKGDMLTKFYDSFAEMHGAVRQRHEETNEVIRRFLDAVDSVGDGALVAELEEQREQCRARQASLS